jgi:hypothetical protein
MTNRRSFLASLVALAVAPFARRPTFVGYDSWYVPSKQQVIYIPQRKMITRIRITEEALADFDKQAFETFMREDARALARDIDRAYMGAFK